MKRFTIKKEDARTLLLQDGFVKFADWYTLHPGYSVFVGDEYKGTLRYDTFDKLRKELNLQMTNQGYSYQIWRKI